MVRIGKASTLEVVKFTDQGAYLDGGPYGEILLPIDVTEIGAFLDWGLPKNLFVPFREQYSKMEVDKWYFVYVYIDEITGRIAASAKFRKYINNEFIEFVEGDEVDLQIARRTDIGYTAIINGKHGGVVYLNEVFKPIRIGDKLKGYVKKIREDGKIDLSLEKQGYKKVDPVSADLLERIKANGGELTLNDKSDPELIKAELGISKKTFKKAVGALYRDKLIVIEENGIKLA
jgi:predicted RNA-binding protein (virulence factor B family)